jgi:tRNA-specific 2-thiouridylase
MVEHKRKIRALGLCSGGLDSILSALVLRDQGIEVEWVTFETPFFSAAKARRAAQATGIPLTVQDITEVYMGVLVDPPCGYGQHMNPCMDCHALMFRLAGNLMKRKGIDFLFSGEVLGQRPMSQTRPSLRYVEKRSGMDGYILRPLSAKRLPETIPEKEGWVDRERLGDLAGRSRKPQIRMAAFYGVTEYPAPAGGCLLTDKGFCSRLKDLFEHQKSYPAAALHLLKHGRHFRLDPRTKIVVGRTKQDNDAIQRQVDPSTDTILKTQGYPGPLVVMPSGGSADTIPLAAAICASYSKAPKNTPVNVIVEGPANQSTVSVLSLPPTDFNHLLI